MLLSRQEHQFSPVFNRKILQKLFVFSCDGGQLAAANGAFDTKPQPLHFAMIKEGIPRCASKKEALYPSSYPCGNDAASAAIYYTAEVIGRVSIDPFSETRKDTICKLLKFVIPEICSQITLNLLSDSGNLVFTASKTKSCI